MDKEKVKVKDIKRKPSPIEEDSVIRAIEQELRNKAMQEEEDNNV